MGLIRNELMDTGGGSFHWRCGAASLRPPTHELARAIVVAQGDDAVCQATFYFEVNR